MRLPQSRTLHHRARHGRRLFTLVASAVAAVLLGAGVTLVVRSRAPILPFAETARSLDAIELWRVGEYSQVMDVASKHLERYPMDETSLSLRGFARFYLAMDAVAGEDKQDLLVQSVQDLRRVLLLASPSMEPQVRYVLGKAYYHRGEFFFDSAVNQLEHAQDLGVENLDLLEYLALAHAELGNEDRAVSYFRSAISLGDEDIHRLRLADLLIIRERYDEAEVLLIEVLESTRDVTLQQHALLSLGTLRRSERKYEAAIARYQELLEINPNSAQARFQLGETYLVMGERDRARFEWREALRLNPNHIESFQRLQE